MAGLIDIMLLAVVAVVAWSVASEGPWGAAFTLISVLFAGLLAMNFYEPVAAYLEQSISSSRAWGPRWDVIALIGLFALGVFLLRFATEYLAPTLMPVHPMVYEAGRWGIGVVTGYVTMAFLLTALHTAPLPREFLGFRPERNNFFGVAAPDRQWLGFTQYVSEKVFRKGQDGRLFDGPRFSVGNVDNRVWPSFPIRYASRREAIAQGRATSTTATRPPPTRGSSGKRRSGPKGF